MEGTRNKHGGNEKYTEMFSRKAHGQILVRIRVTTILMYLLQTSRMEGTCNKRGGNEKYTEIFSRKAQGQILVRIRVTTILMYLLQEQDCSDLRLCRMVSSCENCDGS
jgi:hypothetical protein